MAEAEGLNGQVDVSSLGDVELILQRADTPISLQEETAPRAIVVPLLEKKDTSVSQITLNQARWEEFLSKDLNNVSTYNNSACILKVKCIYLF